MPRPIMFMLAGPNGAGKSTLYETVLKRVPAWARDLYAAASFADAKTIAERIGGSDATTRVGGFGLERTTRGEVVGESAEH